MLLFCCDQTNVRKERKEVWEVMNYDKHGFLSSVKIEIP